MDVRTTKPHCSWKNNPEIVIKIIRENPREEVSREIYPRGYGTLAWSGKLIYITTPQARMGDQPWNY